MASCDLKALEGLFGGGLFDGIIGFLRRREGPSSGVIVSFGDVMGPFVV